MLLLIFSILARGEYDFSSILKETMSSTLRPIIPNYTAHISFFVRVPVLSEQMTDVHPRVSTDGSLRTMQLF